MADDSSDRAALANQQGPSTRRNYGITFGGPLRRHVLYVKYSCKVVVGSLTRGRRMSHSLGLSGRLPENTNRVRVERLL
jgi:hypothetical protein